MKSFFISTIRCLCVIGFLFISTYLQSVFSTFVADSDSVIWEASDDFAADKVESPWISTDVPAPPNVHVRFLGNVGSLACSDGKVRDQRGRCVKSAFSRP